jgi:hypothetical protein
MTAPDFATLYDFSVIETAVESLANTANPDVSWLTGFDAAQLQKARPRIECYFEPGNAFGSPPHYVNTAADGQRRVNGWQGQLRTMIVTNTVSGNTEADAANNSYKLHMQYRAFVMNLLCTVDTALADNPVLLPYHQIARCWEAGNSPKIAPQDGVYTSQLNHNLIYSIRPSAFPGGIINA